MSGSIALRRALAEQANEYADRESIPRCFSYGDAPTVCFYPYDDDSRHGNFFDATYKAILANPEWRKRLAKVHTSGRHSFPMTDRGRWRELDTCMSSDALLMNIFCHPGGLRKVKVSAILNVDPDATPIFGFRAHVPLANGRFDRTEIDMRLGALLVEAKLTESDFQSAEKSRLFAYRDFIEVFDWDELPQTASRFVCYQLLRNVLAAHAMQCSFCVLVDSRRSDVVESWYSVMRCVRSIDLRTRLKICTWQELAGLTPPALRAFLRAKYGIQHPA